ncbi:MAG: hypothetical protein ACXAD7_11985 [Candidatus Kariarchaeaceae archaeon]|jgi:response regulator RpfG family c-di-GMP phosphodiesterase
MMVGRSQSDPEITYLESPEITNLLVVGESETSMHLMQNLINLAKFVKIVNVTNCQDAATLLLLENYSVVILDNDSKNINATSFSRVVRLNHPITRIIVISQENSKKFIYDLFNKGSIDSFLPIPVDDITAHSVIIEQQAKYQIGSALKQLVKKPPKFSHAYYLLYDQTLMKHDNRDFEFLGCVISQYSVNRFAFFYDNFLTKDESLLSVYISAITLIGQHLFEQQISMEEINFGGISIFFHFENDLQFSFLVSNLHQYNAKKAEGLINNIISDLLNQAFPIISTHGIIVDYQDELIAEIIDSRVRSNDQDKLKHPQVVDHLNLIVFGEEYRRLTNILVNEFPDIIIEEIKQVEQLAAYMGEHLVDILVINPITSEESSNLPMAIQLKDVSPKTQMIGILDAYSVQLLLKILETGAVEYVFSNTDSDEQIGSLMKRIDEKARRLRKNTRIPIPYYLRYSFDQSEFTRSLFRMHPKSYTRLAVAQLFGLFIARDNLPFYSKIWSEDTEDININSDLFAGFISSLAFFSNEMFNTSEQVTGIKFGDTSLIIQNLFGYCFVFFAGNLDYSNIPIIQRHVQITSTTLYELLATAIEIDEELSLKIEQHIVELFMKFSLMD